MHPNQQGRRCGVVGDGQMPTPDDPVLGWDVGGAHLKACWWQHGAVQDVAQWACPLWMGLSHLDAALHQASTRWPTLFDGSQHTAHAITMTGEMVDHFADRATGVRRIAAHIAARLTEQQPGVVRFYAGDAGWCAAHDAATAWPQMASANWLATLRHVARHFDQVALDRESCGLLIDIGSTTTDILAFAHGQASSASRSDAQRLTRGELVYHGVVRTPLCALAQRITLRGGVMNVMNEFFATTADVYRLTGELHAAHDQQPSADGGPKDWPATQQRLARMVGLDAADATQAEWLQNALAWRAAQVAEIAGQVRRVWAAQPGARGVAVASVSSSASSSIVPLIVSAGSGGFLVADVLAAAGLRSASPVRVYGGDVAPIAAHHPQRASVQAWAQVCAPSVAVAALFAQGLH
jgi:(4-(4-[2-(gamma-L-glutamylamino)ethyl]phenoxymethyl)furan-2-yl)methanamine synthase